MESSGTDFSSDNLHSNFVNLHALFETYTGQRLELCVRRGVSAAESV